MKKNSMKILTCVTFAMAFASSIISQKISDCKMQETIEEKVEEIISQRKES